MALIVWQKPNVLLLDEPTNHLDLDMRSALTMALQEFTGALIVVSHDRHLLRHSVDEYILAHQGKVEDFDGTLDDYHRLVSDKNAGSSDSDNQASDKSKPAKAEKHQTNKEEKPSLNKKQQRQQSAEQRKAKSAITNRLKRVEQKMQKAETRLAEVEGQLANNDLYEADKKDELTDLIHQQAEIKGELAALEENWLMLSEELEG